MNEWEGNFPRTFFLPSNILPPFLPSPVSLSLSQDINIKMSRFFQGSDSDTDTSSSSEDEMYSESEEESDQHSDMEAQSDEDESEESDEGSDYEARGPAARRDYFMKGAASDESDEEGGKRVVKSARDKRLQEIEATTKAIENGGKINDWVVISNGT